MILNYVSFICTKCRKNSCFLCDFYVIFCHEKYFFYIFLYICSPLFIRKKWKYKKFFKESLCKSLREREKYYIIVYVSYICNLLMFLTKIDWVVNNIAKKLIKTTKIYLASLDQNKNKRVWWITLK